MHAYTIDHTDNSAWYRQMSAGWARRMIKGETPGEWANNTESDVLFAISQLDLHEHVEIEQTFVLEGSIVDEEGEVRAGDYVWRPKGNRHVARAPNGALVLSFFLRPNKFLTGELAGTELK